jgi:UDP-N-acetylmuramate dehydrogenase
MAPYTTLRLGGPAQAWVDAQDEVSVAEAFAWARQQGLPVLVLGGGSNLVVSDAGFPGLVVNIDLRGVTRHGEEVDVAAGEPWDDFVATCVGQGLAGVECLSGIPGRVGATPMQNVGAYGQEVAETITSVRVWDSQSGDTSEIPSEACGFAYRQSRFKGRDLGRYVILSVRFRLHAGTPRPVRYGELSRRVGERPASLAAVREAVLALRKGKGMVLEASDPDTQSVGSFFLNPVVDADTAAALEASAGPMPAHRSGDDVKLSAAWLIETAGFHRGFGSERIAISGKHTLALTHRGGGTTTELLELAATIRDGVRQRLGVALHPEPNFVNCGLQ